MAFAGVCPLAASAVTAQPTRRTDAALPMSNYDFGQSLEIAAATAVARILQLHRETVRIGEIELRRSAGRAAAILHPHRHVMTQRTGRTRHLAARLEAEALRAS